MNIVEYEHHGCNVKVRDDLKGKHRKYCLCMVCANLKPGQEDNCPIAQATFENCVKFNTTTPMFECPKYKEGEPCWT